MARESFLTTPYIDLDAAYVSVSPFTNDRGETAVVLHLGGGISIHVNEEALLVRLADVAAHGRDQLARAVVVEPQLALTDVEAVA